MNFETPSSLLPNPKIKLGTAAKDGTYPLDAPCFANRESDRPNPWTFLILDS